MGKVEVIKILQDYNNATNQNINEFYEEFKQQSEESEKINQCVQRGTQVEMQRLRNMEEKNQ